MKFLYQSRQQTDSLPLHIGTFRHVIALLKNGLNCTLGWGNGKQTKYFVPQSCDIPPTHVYLTAQLYEISYYTVFFWTMGTLHK